MFWIIKYQGKFNSSFDEVDYEVRRICSKLFCSKYRFTSKFIFMLDYSLRELFNNAVEHGNLLLDFKVIQYSIGCTRQYLEIKVEDEGNGFDLKEIIKQAEQADQEEPLRIRKRGLFSIIAVGFNLIVDKGSVCARLEIDDAEYFDEIEENKMEITFKDDTVYCNVNRSVIAVNIKELVEKFKTEVEARDDYQVVQIDLSKSESIDSMGITFLIGIYKVLSTRGKKLKLTGASDAMLQLFKIMKLDEIFEMTTH